MDNSTPNYQDLLVRYLDGDLSEQERTTLERRLADDPQLQSELNSLKETREAIKLYGLREKVANIHQQVMRESATPVKQISQARKIIRYAVSIAAAILVIVLGITVFNFYNLSPNKILATNYISYELSTTRDNDTSETRIQKAYRDKQYDEVIKAKRQAINSDDKMLVAMSYFEQKNYAEAIDEYKNVIEGTHPIKDKRLHETAQYYMAIAFIGNKDYDYAIDRLTLIHEDESHLYHERVGNRIIRQVKMLKWR